MLCQTGLRVDNIQNGCVHPFRASRVQMRWLSIKESSARLEFFVVVCGRMCTSARFYTKPVLLSQFNIGGKLLYIINLR